MPTFESFKTMIIGLLASAILVLSSAYKIHVGVLKKERDYARNELAQVLVQVKEQNVAVEQWKAASDAKDAKLKHIQKKIRIDMLNAQKESDAIMVLEVPVGCEDAAKWAQIQAERMGIE